MTVQAKMGACKELTKNNKGKNMSTKQQQKEEAFKNSWSVGENLRARPSLEHNSTQEFSVPLSC